MAKQRMTLDSVVAKPVTVDPTPEEGAAPQPAAQPARKRTTPSNAGKTQQTVYLLPPVYELLRKVAFDEHKKMHDLLMEGLSRVFEARGLPTVDELNKTATRP